jgi:DNA modification methylase
MKPYYENGSITIYHGDCREILPTLPKVDLVLTDPPYGVGLRNGDVDGHRSRRWDRIEGDSDQAIGSQILEELCGVPTIAFASPWLPWPGKWRNLIVWDKGGAVGGGGDIATCLKRSWELIQVRDNAPLQGPRDESVWRFPMIPADTALHIAQKPVALLVALIEKFGGRTILDPFLGSGTTLVACKRLGRRGIGIEIEEKYCEIAARRLEAERLELFEAAGIDQQPWLSEIEPTDKDMAMLGWQDQIKEEILGGE